jgi:hypothetical protein
MSNDNDYKSQIMKDLAGGNKESLDDDTNAAKTYQNFDDFAQRSSTDERHQLFSRSFHPDAIPSSQMEPELQKAIAQIEPNERGNVAKEFFSQLSHKGVKDRQLEQQLGLTTHDPNRMTAEDVGKLASFA